ncbi:MAG: response regulator [Bacteroidota bacterium]
MQSIDFPAILVIDEDPTLLFLTKELLQFDGHIVYAVSTAPDAIAEFDKHRGQIQIVFCDAAVIRTGGMHLFDELRRKNNEVMIVVKASLSDLMMIGSMAERHNVHILMKPYSGKMLLEYANGISRRPAG